MNMQIITQNGAIVALITGNAKIITDTQSALDLIMTVKYEAKTALIAIDKACISDEFFILSNGLAGEILQKFVNYNVKIAIFGDYTKHKSKPLKDFIYESNSGRDIFFTNTKNEAIEKLVRIA